MQTSANGRKMVERQEGWVPHVYPDKYGYPTIGFGHRVRPGEAFPNGITREEGDALMAQDLGTAEHFVNTLVLVPLTQNQFDALVDFAFNCGGGALQHSSVLSRLNAGDYDGSADALLQWCHAEKGGKLVQDPDLLARREAEKALFLTPDAPPASETPTDPAPAPVAEEAADAISTKVPSDPPACS